MYSMPPIGRPVNMPSACIWSRVDAICRHAGHVSVTAHTAVNVGDAFNPARWAAVRRGAWVAPPLEPAGGPPLEPMPMGRGLPTPAMPPAGDVLAPPTGNRGLLGFAGTTCADAGDEGKLSLFICVLYTRYAKEPAANKMQMNPMIPIAIMPRS